MPIVKTDDETRALLTVSAQFPVTGVIFGNLQKDRRHPTLVPAEVAKCGRGNFSGRPTFQRSNELITLAYREYGNKLIIIGCGGVFNAADAYKKIRLGASLVQLITGLVFEGPHLAAQINRGLLRLLARDNFSHLSEAVGVDAH
jgi:dihydroorotate dehydrogenase